MDKPMTETEKIDEILTLMSNGRLIGLSKDTEPLERSAVNKMIAYQLIIPRGNTFDLTSDGYEAIKLGGIENLLTFQEKQRQQPLTQNMTINGSVTGSQIGQSSDFRDFNNKLKVENKTQADNETINQKSIFDIKVLVQYLAWIAGIASAILVYWKYFKG